jgi:hypothetical protein
MNAASPMIRTFIFTVVFEIISFLPVVSYWSKSLFERLATPFLALNIILLDAKSISVTQTEIVLSGSVILLGGFAKPLRSFRRILCNT